MKNIDEPYQVVADTTEQQQTLTPAEKINRHCRNCKLCLKACAFLQHNGMPGDIIRNHGDDRSKLYQLSFNCSLCNLCSHICPIDLEPGGMFLELRREAVVAQKGNYKAHRQLLRYEQLGHSKLFSFTYLPDSSTTVFFPGCALPGARPHQTLQLYQYLQQHQPEIGIILDCCHKPSHDLGRQEKFLANFRARQEALAASGITNIITACPNCYHTFKEYGTDLQVTNVYTILAEKGFTSPETAPAGTYTIHDACSTRFCRQTHRDVRAIVEQLPIDSQEMLHSQENTLCCGEGGAAGCIAAGHAGKWSSKRFAEAGEHILLTYCAGCTAMLYRPGKTLHLLDLLFPANSRRPSLPSLVRPPFTYLNRLKLKLRLVHLIKHLLRAR